MNVALFIIILTYFAYWSLFIFEIEVLYYIFWESVEKKIYDKIRVAESASRRPALRSSLLRRRLVTERVLFFDGPWKLFIPQTRPRPLPRVTGPSSVSVSPRFRLQLGLLVHLDRRSWYKKRWNNERNRRKKAREREGQEEKTWAKAKPGKRQEEKRDTTNQSKAHLARAADSPRSRPCNPSNSHVRPARHSSQANPAKITVLNRDCGWSKT